MKHVLVILVIVMAVAVLVACGGGSSASSALDSAQAGPAAAAPGSGGTQPTAGVGLATDYPDALPASSQLALGTLRLEGTTEAVTPAQAEALLPLWQALQGTALQDDAELNAVLRQIEKTMTSGQLAAIAAMQLTAQDMIVYVEENGLSFGPRPGVMGTPPPGNLSEEERAAMRATAEAGGFAGGPPGSLSEAERAAMRATAEAGGLPGAGARRANGQGEFAPLTQPLVELLTKRAAG